MQHLAKQGVLIMSYRFAARVWKAELRAIARHAAVLDEARRLRNAHRDSNRMGQALRRARWRGAKVIADRHAAAKIR